MEKQTYKNNFRDSPPRIRYTIEISGLLNVILTCAIIFLMINPLSSQNPFDNPILNIQPDDINVTELLTKALTFEAGFERENFLKDYNGDGIYGNGTVAEIGNLNDEKFVVEINVIDKVYPLVCSQNKTDKNRKQFPFLKGKEVNFSGTFSSSGYFGYKGFVIENCVLQRES